MSDNELLEMKRENLFKALNRKGANFVPNIMGASCAMVDWAGKKVTDIIENPEEYVKAMTDVFAEMWVDGNTFAGTLFTPRIEKILDPVQNKFGPDGVTPEHVQMPMMEKDEYDQLIEDPRRFVFEVLLPRKYPKLYEDRVYAKETLKAVTEDKFYSLAFLTQQQSKMMSETYGITDIANFGEVFSNPVDTIFDYFRGFKGTLLDLRRQQDKVHQACDKLWEVYNEPKLAAPVHDFPYACHMTHIAPYLSPKQFEEIYWPYEKRWIERAAAGGTKVWIMMEGHWDKVWHHFLEVPKDSCILHVDDDDICQAKKEIGDHQILEGGLRMAAIRTENIDKIKNDVKHIIDVCAPGGGFLFSSDKAWIAPGDVNQNLIDAYNYAHEYSKQ